VTTTNAWYRRLGDLPGGRSRVECFFNDEHLDGSTIEFVDDARHFPEAERIWSADLDDEQRSRIVVPFTAETAPEAWFVEVRSLEEGRPRVTLVAFCTGQLPDGTIVDDATYTKLPVGNADQSAAIRWWADTAIVDEIFVQTAFRRTHLGTKLIYTASGFHQHHRWPDRLHSDGRRTDLGQRFVAGLRHPDRIASWTDRAADMDPPEPT